MPEFEVTNSIKAIAAIIALIAAYFSSSDWLKPFLAHINPLGPVKEPDNSPQTDTAVRTLLDDSKSRKCRRSVVLLNEWVALRNLNAVPTPDPIPSPITQTVFTPAAIPQVKVPSNVSATYPLTEVKS
jgi:hypothetical protein